MGILARYIMSEIFKLMIPIWLVLAFLILIMEWLANLFKENASTSTILLLYSYKLPTYLQLVFPVAVLFSCLAVFGSMNRNREIVAAQSLGTTVRRLWLPAVAAIALASLPYLWLTTEVAPWGMRRHYETYDQKVLHVPSRFSQIRQEKIWYRNQDILYNVRYFASDKNELYDVTIYTFDDNFQIAQTIYANSATWNGSNWVLSDGTINLTDKRLEFPLSQKFKTRSTSLIEEPKTLKRVEFNAETMGQGELGRAIKRHHALGINTVKWEVSYQSRFSFFLISFIFLFLAFPRALRFRRGSGAARDGVFVAGVCLTYWLLFNLGINLGNAGKLNPVLAAWGPSLIFMIGVYFYNRSRNLRTESE